MSPLLESYDKAYARWRAAPGNWWAEAAKDIDWIEPWETLFDPDMAPYGRWFAGGWLNTSANCLDRHVANGRGDQAAIIWDSPLAGEMQRISYVELLNWTARFAGALKSAGATYGSRVIIYMPMIPEAVVAMLATARIGAIHSVVFGGFAPAELAARIADATPDIIVTASCGIEPGRIIEYKPLVDQAIAMSPHKPQTCFVVQRPMARAEMTAGRDRDFHEALTAEPADYVPVRATDPLYILYTSGTTGKPKGIVRDNGGHAAALLQSMQLIYGAAAGDTVWAASDIGWVVGHSYIVYGPLLAGCTSVLYEGKPVKTPDAGAFWRVCAHHGVKSLFTAPTAIRAIRQEDVRGDHARQWDLSRLRTIFLAGERCDPPTADWLRAVSGKRVIDHWWQTETGWPITAGFAGLDCPAQPAGSAGRPAPGWHLSALNSDGDEVPAGETGALMIKLPLPPGATTTLWNNDSGFRDAYLNDPDGWYRTGDSGCITEGGDVIVGGRMDDVINVAGHRLSTSVIEDILASHPDVVECAVIAVRDALKGHIPLGLFVCGSKAETPEVVAAELVQMVRERIGAVACFKMAVPVARLPKTRSGKILRKTMRQMADGDPVIVPSTVEDVDVVSEVRGVLARYAPPAM